MFRKRFKCMVSKIKKKTFGFEKVRKTFLFNNENSMIELLNYYHYS